MGPENTPQPGTTVSPQLGGTLNGSEGPTESAHQHEVSEKAYASASIAKAAAPRDLSQVEMAHNNLLDTQVNLHDKLTLLAKRLESVLTQPFKGSDGSTSVSDSYGSSPVAHKLATSTSVTASSHDVVDHLLNNIEV